MNTDEPAKSWGYSKLKKGVGSTAHGPTVGLLRQASDVEDNLAFGHARSLNIKVGFIPFHHGSSQAKLNSFY